MEDITRSCTALLTSAAVAIATAPVIAGAVEVNEVLADGSCEVAFSEDESWSRRHAMTNIWAAMDTRRKPWVDAFSAGFSEAYPELTEPARKLADYRPFSDVNRTDEMVLPFKANDDHGFDLYNAAYADARTFGDGLIQDYQLVGIPNSRAVLEAYAGVLHMEKYPNFSELQKIMQRRIESVVVIRDAEATQGDVADQQFDAFVKAVVSDLQMDASRGERFYAVVKSNSERILEPAAVKKVDSALRTLKALDEEARTQCVAAGDSAKGPEQKTNEPDFSISVPGIVGIVAAVVGMLVAAGVGLGLIPLPQGLARVLG